MKSDSSKRTRPVARDIKDSLGKLPPAAIDLEEMVLGQLLISTTAFEQVKEFLFPEYFYTEIHQEIFRAIKTIGDKNEGINLMTVVFQLRKTGKIELVGGASYVAELSAKVSTDGNLIAHSRIIIELAVKRELIQVASTIHNDAYEDTTDAIELFDKSLENLKAFHEKAFKSNGPQKIKELWKELLLLTEPEDMPPILFIDGIPIAWPGGHSLLVGKKKSRKTLFVVWLISQFLQRKDTTGEEVLIFDTEQSKRHVYAIRKKIDKMTGKRVAVFYLRGRAPADRVDFIRETVKHWPTPPKLIVIDGVRDLMVDINDPEESTNTSLFIEQLTLTVRPEQKFPPHVIEILHLNKSDSNPRGHIGTELQNKAECTILLELDEKADCTNVKCESSREKPFNPFSFSHDSDYLPQVVVNANHKTINEDDTKTRLKEVFEEDQLSYSEIINNIKIKYGDTKPLGTNKAQVLLAKFLRNGWIIKSGKPKDPKTKYKMTVQPGDYISYAPPAPSPQLEITNRVPVPIDDDDLPF